MLVKGLRLPYYEDGDVRGPTHIYRVAAAVGPETGAASEPLQVNPPWMVWDPGRAKPGTATFSADRIRAGSTGSRIGLFGLAHQVPAGIFAQRVSRHRPPHRLDRTGGIAALSQRPGQAHQSAAIAFRQVLTLSSIQSS